MGERIHSIDSLRAIAVFFVVVAHVQPFHGFEGWGNYVYFALEAIAQFDVPFFFATSGYFLATKLDAEASLSDVSGTVRKLGSLYLFGILVYLPVLVFRTASTALLEGRSVPAALAARFAAALSPVDLLYYGHAVALHLWFLTALAIAVCVVALFAAAGKTRYLLPVAAAAHVIGLLGENAPMLFDPPLPTRDMLFFGLFYVALGFSIRRVDWTPSADRRRLYLGAFGLLLAVQLAEQYAIGYLLHERTLSQAVYLTEYTVTTVFLVLALFAYALSNPDLGRGTALPALGNYAVGVYLVHLPIYHAVEAVNDLSRLLVGFDARTTLLWHLVMTPLVYVLALALYRLAARTGVIDPDGSHVPRLGRIRSALGSSRAEHQPAD